ncbi:uncharacterized protein DEA37_0005787 [Paragonimus westermani]|uniref:Uncharacterized protein n=1 Tax=Paragonimus westermani TaxID=34504 RepID=A0A5J4NT12_9TREM|nr:uncharacterized protein DEA37_0005787 [Paragonimus westermani]
MGEFEGNSNKKQGTRVFKKSSPNGKVAFPSMSIHFVFRLPLICVSEILLTASRIAILSVSYCFSDI